MKNVHYVEHTYQERRHAWPIKILKDIQLCH